MKKLLTASAIALGLAIPAFMPTSSFANDTVGTITENYVPVIAVRDRGNQVIQCRVNEGDRVRIRGTLPNGRVRISFRNRCFGTIHAHQVRRDATDVSEIFTTGRWGSDVPVFRDRDSYFNARDRNKVENVVCRLRRGMHVKFTPYRDWGLGEVIRENCKGWIDRGVVRPVRN